MSLESYIEEDFSFKAWIDEYLEPLEVKTIFEIGACEAEDSIKLSYTYPNAKVYAFEPLPKNIKLSQKHIKDFKADRIELFPYAMSDNTGSTTFYVSSGRPDLIDSDPNWDYGNKSSSLLAPEKTKNVHEWLKFNEEISVKTERLDNFCKQKNITEIDLIYMDVQGAELMVLEGAGNLIKKIKAVWLEVEAVELYKGQPLRRDVENFMRKSGFECVMDTVDSVSGDQLYVRSDIVNKYKKLKKSKPNEYVFKLNGLLSYIDSVWTKPNTSLNLKLLLEKRAEEINLEINKLKLGYENSPTVSFVLSIYNGEKFLKLAIESILNQTYQDFEFILIDDGSVDKSAEIVKKFNDPRIRLISQINHGFIYSLNRGVSLARAKYIARMDQDDIALPTRLEKQLLLFKQNPRLGAVSTYFELINFKDSKPLGTVMTFPINSIDIKRSMYLHNPMAHGATTFLKKAWEESGKYSEDYHPPEDYDLWRKIGANWDLGMVPEVLFQYRINNPESMSQKNITNGEENIKRIQNELADGPFIKKGLIQLIKDYRGIGPKNYGEYYVEAKINYLNLQQGLSKLFLEKHSVSRSFSTTAFVVLIKPKQSKTLIKKFIKVLLINFRNRLK